MVERQLPKLHTWVDSHHPLQSIRKNQIMTNEAEVLAALDKPYALYALQQRVDPSNKSTEALQELLMQMRTAGKVKFDIKTGKWAKA